MFRSHFYPLLACVVFAAVFRIIRRELTLQDLDKDDYIPPPYRLAPAAEVHRLILQQAAERKDREKRRQKKLGEHGFEMEHSGEILF